MIKIFEIDCVGCDYVGEGIWNDDGQECVEYNLQGNKMVRKVIEVGSRSIYWTCKECSTKNKSIIE